MVAQGPCAAGDPLAGLAGLAATGIALRQPLCFERVKTALQQSGAEARRLRRECGFLLHLAALLPAWSRC